MVKQSLQTCTCGHKPKFPEGEVRTVCRRCGAVWEVDNCGCWFTQSVFAPFVARPKKQTRKRRKAGKK